MSVSIAACWLWASVAGAGPLSFGRPTTIERIRGFPEQEAPAASCPTARLCVATDGSARVDVSTRPSGGRRAYRSSTIGSGGYLAGVSCPSRSLCVAPGADDQRTGIYMSIDPTRGSGAWRYRAARYRQPRVLATVRDTFARSRSALCVVVSQRGWLVVGHRQRRRRRR